MHECRKAFIWPFLNRTGESEAAGYVSERRRKEEKDSRHNLVGELLDTLLQVLQLVPGLLILVQKLKSL
jgi:hypothetical protein